MDDDDESMTSIQILKECDIADLAAKCKPLNVNLDRLDLSKNSIILIKNDAKRGPSSSPEREQGSDVKKGKQEINSNDTAETIKKIKEFIAMGRCEDSKKDAEVTEKPVYYRPGPLSKKKLLAVNNHQRVKAAVNSDIAKLNMGLELERTLKGQDDEDLHLSEVDQNEKEVSCGRANRESSSESKYSDATVKNSELVTPSRVSKRIQSKSVKFSVKKLLRGDDVNVLKRMIPGYDEETPSRKERSVIKTVKHEVKKVSQHKSPSPSREKIEEADEISQEAIPPLKEPGSPLIIPTESRVSTPEASENHGEFSVASSPVSPSPSNTPPEQKISALAEKLGRFAAVTNGKITLELKGLQQKKVVRIAIPPSKTSSPLPKTILGPDIIVKRVKPVKKTLVVPENVKSTSKTTVEKEIEDYRPPHSVNSDRKTNAQPLINVERIPAPKSKTEILQIQKSILRRHSKAERKLESLKEIKSKSIDKAVDGESLNDAHLHHVSESESNAMNLVHETAIDKRPNQKKESKHDTPSLTQQITEALEDTVSKLEEVSPLKDDLKKAPDKSKVKKFNYSVKSKTETLTKKPIKPRKADVLPEKSPPSSDAEEPVEKHPESLFDRYFRTEERYIEHHDSLDSDSSDDYDKETYSHFINLKRHKEVDQDAETRDDCNMYEMMRNISVELPSWNIHVSSNGEMFYLAQVDVAQDKPTMKKVIEIDLEYNAKVYIGGHLMPEYGGNYRSYEDLKQLVYDIDQM